MSISLLTNNTASVFKGEGYTHRLKKGVNAAYGVKAHEATNVGVLTRQVERAGREVVSSEIEVKYAYNPQTGRTEVVGGRARVRHQEKKSKENASSPSNVSSNPPSSSQQNTQVNYRQAEANLERALWAAQQGTSIPNDKNVQENDENVKALRAKLQEVQFARQMDKISETLKMVASRIGKENEPTDPSSQPTEGIRRGSSHGVFLPAMTVSGLHINTSV